MALVAVTAFALGVTLVSADEHRDGVFVHISHGKDDPHRLLMALNMAVIMSEDHDVLVYFDIRGIDAVLKDSEDVSYSHFPTSKTQLATLKERGVTLMACPGCLKAAGKTKDDLADGVQIADKARFFSFTKGRILTLDY
jgi:predicted peroxiredoxin